jgi:hypothetical protein
MASNDVIPVVDPSALETINGDGFDAKKVSTETLLLLITYDRLNYLEKASRDELKELKKRQQEVAFHHKLIKALNTATDKEGKLDITELADLQEMLQKAVEMGVDIDTTKLTYDREERDRLLDNIKMTVDDLSVQNEMQLQRISQLTNERYESLQFARAMMKPLHEDKQSKARAIAGR